MIARIGVVVPARDEEQLIGAALRSIADAAAGIAVPVHVVVAADGCTDGTVRVARSLGVEVLDLPAASVGAARAAGAERALAAGADWLAHTDADSEVPPDWLVEQLRMAELGADVVIGTVRPRFADLSGAQVRAWLATHAQGQAIGHVHGANLGTRASAYLRAGGYRSLREHEDVDLVERMRPFAAILETDAAEVVTSGRRIGRTDGGYAGYLREQLLPLAAASEEDAAAAG
ncbi:glycosyltransferase [Pseudolysinimonas sp.]|uniref:glycosyltransferase n=1 Tax=Pseudolysinimonas sp. TaxID=2680009 RepID=UPI003F7F9D28